MKSRGLVALLALTVSCALPYHGFGQTPVKPIDKGQRVFTAGNSFHAWFIAPILKDMAEKAGINGHEIVGVSKIGGSRAIQHWEVPEEKNEAKASLRAGKVDILTLACMLQPDEGIDKFAELGLEHNPNFRVSLQEFWIPWDKFEWPFQGRPESVDNDAATGASLRELHEPYFKAMDDHVVALNARLGKPVVFVAPVGQAIIALREKIRAGEVPGIEKQSDLFTDKLGHPRPSLEALVAYVHFAVIYRRSPVGLPLPAVLADAKKPQWDEKLNRVLQELAWNAVVNHPLSGVSQSDSGTTPTPAPIAGEKTAWHGFDRYDFLMDEDNLTLKPIKAADDEHDGIKGEVKGQRRCIVVVPKTPAPGKPWSWQGCYWNHEPQTEVELLRRGFHIGYVAGDPGKHWDAWYAFLTESHGLSKKPAFVGMSRGGVNEYAWATVNPDKVSCIYADNPALRAESLQKIGELAKRDVPLLHICGSLDFLLQQHTLPAENVYHQLGGRFTTMIKEGAAHHPHSVRDARPIADWIEQNVNKPNEEPPAYAGKRFTKSSYYSFENSYQYLKEEKTYATCRGPSFTDCFDRYDVRSDSQWGITAMTVIVPKTPAPGKPWVFQADRIGREATVVDLALLAKGYHIVAPPVLAQSGPLREQWDAVYKLLTDHGFSTKPVMEGAGTAAGEAYAWAIENPDKVSCIYGENPALRSLMSKKVLVDHLAPLAKAAVPLIHVCGSLDPWLDQETRVVQKRYEALGGPITVIVKEGEGHYPLAPKDPKAVVDLITAASAR